jgi:lipopolysaccharide transport system ATP-binding protein
MASTVIKIENLHKEYRLGLIGHGTIYRDLQSWWAKSRGREDPNSIIGLENGQGAKGRILALSDINFEVGVGEVLGIIGANGAGKSTLLKILSRITAPTKGTIKVKGRLASLLEVGTGFHPELTGRENIFLNGAINGMNRGEVSKRLDEIVDFAGVDQFLDTPVKRYSSGMYVRLGFAVAAHLDPEILVVDEVLAVGDAGFQKKAVGKMKEVSENQGRTVLFVSHNMTSIRNLCTRAVLLAAGTCRNDGPVEDVINSYLSSVTDQILHYSGERKWKQENGPGNAIVALRAIRTKNAYGEVSAVFEVQDDIALEIDYQVLKEGHQICVTVEFLNEKGDVIFHSFDDFIREPWTERRVTPMGITRQICRLPGDFLNEGDITINLRLFSPPKEPNVTPHVRELSVISFRIVDEFNQGGVRGSYPYSWGQAAVRPRLSWRCETVSEADM